MAYLVNSFIIMAWSNIKDGGLLTIVPISILLIIMHFYWLIWYSSGLVGLVRHICYEKKLSMMNAFMTTSSHSSQPSLVNACLLWLKEMMKNLTLWVSKSFNPFLILKILNSMKSWWFRWMTLSALGKCIVLDISLLLSNMKLQNVICDFHESYSIFHSSIWSHRSFKSSEIIHGSMDTINGSLLHSMRIMIFNSYTLKIMP